MKKVLKHTMSAAAAGGLLLVLYAMKELFPFWRVYRFLVRYEPAGRSAFV